METTSKANQFIRWFVANGGHFNKAMEIVHSLEYGYHYIARHGPLRPQDAVCQCPLSLTISYLNVIPRSSTVVRNNSLSSACSHLTHNPEINRSTIAFFFLAEQRLKSKNSFWFPYIQLLPRETDMTTPLWFTEEELLYLRGTNLFSNGTPLEKTSIGRQKAVLREQWAIGISELEVGGVPTGDFTWQLFLWAATIFSSRSFTSDMFTTEKDDGSFPILYPALDILNHRIGINVTWQFQNGDFSLHLKEEIEEGQQVFNNYSPKGNEDLLMGFGFCILNNPYDRVAFRLGQVRPETHHRLRQSIPSHWKSETWDDKESVFYVGLTSQETSTFSNNHGVPGLSCLRGIPPALTKSVYVIMLHYIEDTVSTGEMLSGKQIWAGVIEVLTHQIELSVLGITRWNAELPKLPSTAGAKAATIYREGQINILKETVAGLKAFIHSLQAGDVSLHEVNFGAEETVQES